MENIMQKRKIILENEQEILAKICSKCDEKTFLKEWNVKNNQKIQTYILKEIGYVYVLKEQENYLKKITNYNKIILSPIELRKITEDDFGEEDYFLQSNNKIGYTTKIESGLWVVAKKDEIRYVLKSNNKKIAVIQIKKTYKNNIEQQIFSYSNKIENKINKSMEQNTKILDVILEIITEKSIQKELCQNENKLDNKSLKLLIKELKLSIDLLQQNEIKENNEQQELSIKLQKIGQKYTKIYMQLETETENMRFNTTEGQETENRALLLIRQENSLIKSIKELTRAVGKLLKSNIFERQNSDVKVRR